MINPVARWRLNRQPPILDEDGKVRVPVLWPGESVVVEVDPETGAYTRAVVTRPNGRVRVRADWTHRA